MKNRKFTFSGQSGTKNHCSCAQIWDENGNSLAVIESTEDEKDATDVAKLMHAAPEMLEACEEALRMYEAINPVGGWQGVEDSLKYAIKKAKSL